MQHKTPYCNGWKQLRIGGEHHLPITRCSDRHEPHRHLVLDELSQPYPARSTKRTDCQQRLVRIMWLIRAHDIAQRFFEVLCKCCHFLQ